MISNSNLEEVLANVQALALEKLNERLSEIEVAVFKGSWNNERYEEIAKKSGFSIDYISKVIGFNLWKKLTAIFGVRITKKNFKSQINSYLNLSKFVNPSLVDAVFDIDQSPAGSRAQREVFAKSGNVVPMKYLYSSQTASNIWLSLCKNGKYSFYQDSLEFIRKISDDFSKVIDKNVSSGIKFVSLGCGDGKKDFEILNSLISIFNNKKITYHPIDISQTMIIQTIHSISKIREKINVKAIFGDFMNLQKYKHIFENEKEKCVFSFLGNSFGNLKELEIINAISCCISAGDFILIEVNVGDPEDVIKDHDDPINVQFNFSPLASLGVPFDNSLLVYEIKDNKKDDISISDVPDTKSLITKYKEAKIGDSYIKNLTLSIMHHYNSESLIKYLESYLSINILECRIEKNICLILAQVKNL